MNGTMQVILVLCVTLCGLVVVFVDVGFLIEPSELPRDCASFKWDSPPDLSRFRHHPVLSHEQQQAKIYFHKQQMERQIISMDHSGKHFFQRNWEPSYSCNVNARMGCPGDGGKWVCDPHHFLGTENCVVYSIGSNDEFSFEEAVYDFNPKCEIHTFDHATAATEKPPFLHFHPWKLANHDSLSESKFTIRSIMRRLGHHNISVLKIECGGCELDSFNAVTFPPGNGAIRQILMEVHFVNGPEPVHNLFSFLSNVGYAIFSKEPNIQYSNGNAVEFALVHLGNS